MSTNPFIRSANEIAETKIADELSRTHGFTRAYDTTDKVTRRRKAKGPSRALNLQLPEDEYIRFVEFCDREQLPYWKALVFLMNEYEIKKGGD